MSESGLRIPCMPKRPIIWFSFAVLSNVSCRKMAGLNAERAEAGVMLCGSGISPKRKSHERTERLRAILRLKKKAGAPFLQA